MCGDVARAAARAPTPDPARSNAWISSSRRGRYRSRPNPIQTLRNTQASGPDRGRPPLPVLGTNSKRSSSIRCSPVWGKSWRIQRSQAPSNRPGRESRAQHTHHMIRAICDHEQCFDHHIGSIRWLVQQVITQRTTELGTTGFTSKKRIDSPRS